ncbi:flavin-containing monooxygenase FMO GS-OX-like 4 [Chelonus insularis]|uniref:flavin-containing monooxygenase FMO GS-OX-like 4 n=1 Tax=Chelonus insularis TaxID=460826 RepID=UPI0015891A0A|nr:flavin-containing monooxygenase FMO GS-OX-like 4 [Chelonus insularis]
MSGRKNREADGEIKRERIRVCVIGAGAAGLCSVRHLASDLQKFEPAVFEQCDVIGGTWVYTEKVGFHNGLPIHSSMYKDLKTNIPLKLMNFPDFQRMNQSQPSCGTHQQILKYLQDYADHFNLCQYIQFNTRVENVLPITEDDNWHETTWKVTIKNILTQKTEDKYFDAILVCNGHYVDPIIPSISGIETFSGDLMHSHDYRTPEKYTGKTVLILGSGPSGIDIGIEITHYANHVYLSHNRDRLISPLPSNMTETMGVEFINGNDFHLKDGTTVTADAFLLCTGYKYSFPFLNETCKVKVINGNHVTPLYKHLINIQHPKMAIVGVPSRVIPFPMFHMQIQYFLSILLGETNLPSQEKMSEELVSQTSKYPHAFEPGYQWEYNDWLASEAKIEKLPEFYKYGYSEWTTKRATNLLKYKNSTIVIEEDGKTVRFII